MNNSTLPPLLTGYLPSYERKTSVALPRCEESVHTVVFEQEHVNNYASNELEKKLKRSRAVLAQKRQMEAEEKASKEREEKALHTLRMWNIVKENERKRKQHLLKSRVNLQHQIIKKQDELHELLEKQQRNPKDVHQNSHFKFQKTKLSVGGTNRVTGHHELRKHHPKPSNKPKKSCKKKPVDEDMKEETIHKISEDERHSIVSYKDTFSEEDLSELVEYTTMEDTDFHELRYQPLNMQLEKLFGDKAESYLNPTVEENPRKVLNPTLARRKGKNGATALWETLRDFSRQKLRNKDALILPDVKNAYACFARECLRRHITPVKRNFVSEIETPVNVNVEESDLLKDVRYRRHRQELMYRIAHLNKDKTKLLFQVVGPPHYVDMKTQDGLRRYHPQLTEKEDVNSFPSIPLEDDQARPRVYHVNTNHASNQSIQVKSKDSTRLEKQPRIAGTKLVFLTEEKASCKGQFAKRLTKDEKDTNIVTKSVGSLSDLRNRKPEFLQIMWEPLSMDALLEHKSSFLGRRNYILGQDSCRTGSTAM